MCVVPVRRRRQPVVLTATVNINPSRPSDTVGICLSSLAPTGGAACSPGWSHQARNHLVLRQVRSHLPRVGWSKQLLRGPWRISGSPLPSCGPVEIKAGPGLKDPNLCGWRASLGPPCWGAGLSSLPPASHLWSWKDLALQFQHSFL